MKKKMMFALIVVLFECLMVILSGCDFGLSKQEMKEKTKEIATPIADGLYDAVSETIAKKAIEKEIPAISSNPITMAEIWTKQESTEAEKVLEESSAGGENFDPNIDLLKNMDTSDFDPAMFPSYNQLKATNSELKINVDGNSLSWDISGHNLDPQSGETIKVIVFWFLLDGKVIMFKDWGAINCPYGDNRWYNSDDLRKDHRKVNARETPGAKCIVTLVGTWQPRGANDVSRVIARSKIF